MYNLIIYLYQLGVAIMSHFSGKVNKMWHGEHEALGILQQKVDKSKDYIWFHAASLGEFEQGRPLIESIRKNHPELKILLTFFSPSGYEVRKNYEGADIVCYLPLDTPNNARKFLQAIKPKAAFFIKYEFWYNYLNLLKQNNIPVYSVSSIFREEQIFFRWYGKQYGRVLNCITHFYVQNDVSKKLLNNIGITNVTVTGDTRFDRVLSVMNLSEQLTVIEDFLQHHTTPCCVVGSSWENDEDVYLPYFAQHPELPLIIAPHVVNKDRINKLTRRLQQINRPAICYTDCINGTIDTDIVKQANTLIIDCYGLLSSIYRYADITYVGGGFGEGIHNLLEAAVWEKPVIFGPNNKRFQEACDLKALGGGFEVCCQQSFTKTISNFVDNKEARQTAGTVALQYIRDNAGATDKVLAATIDYL